VNDTHPIRLLVLGEDLRKPQPVADSKVKASHLETHSPQNSVVMTCIHMIGRPSTTGPVYSMASKLSPSPL
jgi:hypothetical protein